MVFSEPHREAPALEIFRVADEQGLAAVGADRLIRPRDELDDDFVASIDLQIRIPVEVRAGADPIRLPGCSIRAFHTAAVRGPDWEVDGIRSGPDLFVSGQPDSTLVIGPGERRLVTLVLAVRSDAQAFGIRLDETPSAPDASGNCTDSIGERGPTVQHVAFRLIEVEPAGPVVVAGVVVLLSAVIIGR